MRKILAYFLALVVCIFPGALAVAAPAGNLEGVILEVREDGSFLLDDIAMGQVVVHVGDNTAVEGVDQLALGQYVFVGFDGAVTKSLPPEATAQKVSCYILEGSVLSVDEATGTALVLSEDYGQVLVRLPRMETVLHAGDYAVVYFSGVMAMSYPGQAGGLKVDVYTALQGTITEIGDGFFLLEGDAGVFRVNIGDQTRFPESLEMGDDAVVYYSGAMTKSLPPQVFGEIVAYQDVE